MDQELVKLLNQRSEISVQIGQLKHEQGIEVWSAAREEEVVAKASGSRVADHFLRKRSSRFFESC